MIFVLTGFSGTGKSTLVNEIQENFYKRGLFIPELKLVTDRPMRPGEKDGESYFFLTKKEYSSFISSGFFATNEVIEVYQDTWRYGIVKDFLTEDRLLAGSPEQVKQLKSFLGDDKVVSINIMTSEEERIKRILNRKDNQHEEEIKRRTRYDIEKYKNFKPDYQVSNDDAVLYAVNDIVNIIEKYI